MNGPATTSERGCRLGDAGLTGLQELAVAIAVAAVLSVGGMFTYQILVSGAGDRAAQATVSTVLAAARDVYEESQDYGLIGAAQPTDAPGGACSQIAPAFSLLGSYASGVDVRCGALTAAATGSVVVSAGELDGGSAGGWIGIATLAGDGTCWQVYQPADGPAVYGSQDTGACRAPVSSPFGGRATW